MNLDQLQGQLKQNKPVVLGVAAAGVVGLALLQRKKAGGDSGAGPATSRPAGTIPAAAVVPSQSYAAPDNSAVQVYNSLSAQLAQMEQRRQTSGTGITSAPEPVASSMFAPNGSGQYVRYSGDGSVHEVQTDGSLYHLSFPEWSQLVAQGTTNDDRLTNYDGSAPTSYAFSSNLKAKIKAGLGQSS